MAKAPKSSPPPAQPAVPLAPSLPSSNSDLNLDLNASAVYQGITTLIQPELAQVETAFTAELATDIPAVAQLLRYVARFRGKMLRPVLLLLSGKAVGTTSPDHITLATVVEMVHMATLVHDDVLDDAELRRKGATINHLKGNEAAVMLGDLLISHAFHLCSSLNSQAASRAIGHTTNQLCEGELLQIDQRNNLDLDEQTYFTIIQRKTAALVATACQLGALHAGATQHQVASLHRYGMAIGTAFQIQDDVLDLTGDTREVGKTLGLDIERAKLTLPLIHFLRTAPREHRDLLKSLLRSADPDKVEKIRNLVLPSTSLAYARDVAMSLVSDALSAIGELPNTPYKAALTMAAKFVTQRAI
jgi:octaprenyl-diphosphate synthase